MNTCLKGWSSANGDKKYLISYVTSQKHVIEESTKFMSGGALHGM